METDRLHIRLINENDAKFLHQLMDNDKWREMIGDRGVYSEADALQYIQERMHPDLHVKGFVNHVMVEKESGEAVGTCSLHDREGVDGIDVGYALLPSFEGKGYASEGARAMVKLAFDTYKPEQVSAITSDENPASYRVLEKIGFTHTGYIQLPGSAESIRLYTLTKNDWNAS